MICAISFGPNPDGDTTICFTTDSVPSDIILKLLDTAGSYHPASRNSPAYSAPNHRLGVPDRWAGQPARIEPNPLTANGHRRLRYNTVLSHLIVLTTIVCRASFPCNGTGCSGNTAYIPAMRFRQTESFGRLLRMLWRSKSRSHAAGILLRIFRTRLLHCRSWAGTLAGPYPTRASGGSRTHNPRITNAVLCQLKLRWRRVRQGGHRIAYSIERCPVHQSRCETPQPCGLAVWAASPTPILPRIGVGDASHNFTSETLPKA